MSLKCPKKLLDLPGEERQSFLNSFDTVLFDCDGVIWNLMEAIPGTGDGVNALLAANKKVFFVSNNSVRPLANYKQQFKSTGVDLHAENLVHPLISIVHYLKKRQFTDLIYVIGTSLFTDTLKAEGFNVIHGPEDERIDSFTALYSKAVDGKPVKAVIVDGDFNFNYTKFVRAQIYLNNPECELILGATDKTLPVSAGLEFPGPGLFTALWKSHQAPVLLGKPSAELTKVLADKFNIADARRVLFVGDSLREDIGFGRASNYQTALVLSGGTTREMLDQHTVAGEIPDFYTDSVFDFVELCKSSL